jgi:hypothetical protein
MSVTLLELLLTLRNFLGFNIRCILKMDSNVRDGFIVQDHEHRDTSVPEHCCCLHKFFYC